MNLGNALGIFTILYIIRLAYLFIFFDDVFAFFYYK